MSTNKTPRTKNARYETYATVVLHQIFPERAVLRWLEAEPSGDPWLVIPLAGLADGDYGLAWAGPNELEGAMEADGPIQARAWIARFRLERP